MLGPPAISPKSRHSDWLQMYPQGPFWQGWHLPLVAHQPEGFVIPIVLTEMETLWSTHTVKTSAGGHLARFERYTLFGHFAPRTTISAGLKTQLANTLLLQGLPGWHKLQEHYDKHALSGSPELPALDAAARALSAHARSRGVPESILKAFFPGRVDDVFSYGTLALSAWFTTRFPDTSFEYLLHASEMHSLNLNLYIPPEFIRKWNNTPPGQGPERGVLVGVGLASAHSLGGGWHVPRLLERPTLSTVFAPSGPPTRVSGFTFEVEFK